MMPARPPALNPKILEMKYALARLTAQKSRDNPTCGSALRPSGLSQSNYYYERIAISMCPSLPNRSSYPSNSVVT
jgi:hypothetical protein